MISDLEKLLEKYQIEIDPVQENEIPVKDIDQIKLKIIERFINILTGKKIRFKVMRRPDATALLMSNLTANHTNPHSRPNHKSLKTACVLRLYG